MGTHSTFALLNEDQTTVTVCYASGCWPVDTYAQLVEHFTDYDKAKALVSGGELDGFHPETGEIFFRYPPETLAHDDSEPERSWQMPLSEYIIDGGGQEYSYLGIPHRFQLIDPGKVSVHWQVSPIPEEWYGDPLIFGKKVVNLSHEEYATEMVNRGLYTDEQAKDYLARAIRSVGSLP